MNDFLSSLDVASWILVKVTFSAALACLTWSGIRNRKDAPDKSTGNSVPAPVQLRVNRPVLIARERETVPAPVAQAEEIIECERCRNEIKSRPILSDTATNMQVYQCESCGAKVQV